MNLHVFRQIIDPFRQDRNLNIRRSCIAGGRGELLNEFFFTFSRNRHRLLQSN